nr:MAG TPA: YopX protein [Caudoviricetes sp.]
MRELKFRAWDNLEKRMRKVVSLHWQGDKLVSAKLEGENEPIPIEGRLEIEQYAEPILADRLICENDIVVDNLSLNSKSKRPSRRNILPRHFGSWGVLV